jgi:heat shock protein HslJ
MRMKTALACGAIVVLAACASPTIAAMDSASLVGKRWIASVEGTAEAGQRPRLEFQPDGRLGGYTGCNSLGGTWRIAGDAVQVSALAMTKRACIGAGNEMEKRFVAAVNEKARITLEAGKLVAQGVDGARIVFLEERS